MSAKEIRKDAFGNINVSVKADVTNFGKKGQVLVKVVAVDRDGYELDSLHLPITFMDTRDNKEITSVTILKTQVNARIKEWIAKDAIKY